jgi:hypothetical protein
MPPAACPSSPAPTGCPCHGGAWGRRRVRVRLDAHDAAHPRELAVGVVLGILVRGIVEDVDRGDRVGELDLHALQGTGEREGGFVPVARTLGHRALEHQLQRGRRIGPRQRRHRLRLDALDEIRAAVAAAGLLERRAPGQQRVDGRAERVDVGGDAGCRASLNASGGDHGIDMPPDDSSDSAVVAMPKSVSAGGCTR